MTSLVTLLTHRERRRRSAEVGSPSLDDEPTPAEIQRWEDDGGAIPVDRPGHHTRWEWEIELLRHAAA